MHRIHSGLTLAAEIRPGRAKALRKYLAGLKGALQQHLAILDGCDTLLFLSCAIVPAQRYNKEVLPNTFVFATTYSGKRHAHLCELVKHWRTILVDILLHCEGFTLDHQSKDDEIVLLLKKHSKPHAFNSRYNCITKCEIQKDHRLVRDLQDAIDIMQAKRSSGPLSAKQTRKLIQEEARILNLHYPGVQRTFFSTLYEFYRVKRTIGIQLLVLIGFYFFMIFYQGCIECALGNLFFAFLGLLAIALSLAGLITREKYPTATRPPTERVRKLARSQLEPVINDMIASGPLKPGWLRKHFYYYSLLFVNFVKDPFMAVPTVSSIRWVSVNNRKRLLFLSCYHNTTDFYVREFLTGNTPRGVNFLFSHGQGFPDAPYLFLGGISDDPEGYMNVIHKYQQITDFFYAHDPHLTGDVINKNRKIRLGLFGRMTESQSRNWLELF